MAPLTPTPTPLPQQPVASGYQLSPGFSILAIQDPPTAGGLPGAISFASGLSQFERREIADNLAWFDRMDQRHRSRESNPND